MASTTLLLNGFSILNDPKANTAARGGGQLKIHDGEAVFESDDIVALLVENVTVDGVLTDESVIVGIVVYDNASDYYNDVPKYTYSYTGSGDGAEIPDGRSGMGDTYLRFDAGELTSTDAGAPVLQELAMVAGVDLVGQVEAGVNPIDVDTYTDVDYNRDGTIDGTEAADGAFSSELNDWIPICFTRGTLIETPDGPRFIETLQVGDRVNTLDNGPQEIRWIGARRMPGTGHHAPVRIRAGALGNVRDLWVSQNHRMLIRGAQAELLFGQSEVLVAAKHLIDEAAIRVEERASVEYIHFLFDAHQIVFAEACPSESLFPGKQTLQSVDDAARDEIIGLFPELAHAECTGDMSRYALRGYEAQALARIA
ncbi:Hint domain-containing protein [Aestuariicoccus sp. MJ-SS9]|uniref:Hint domain-containing protein n=1 Tax=Aestuariicoccus sp. MJ-SS9 TaxID=3079855 RepID=UPI002908910F|nr:Hint domain-containing protein [Aestuariicoccus sp. MJ-SS9]MDU8911951.1 Hint domain-containing protein [Aestuariicoccus sp. MJ-SS9]